MRSVEREGSRMEHTKIPGAAGREIRPFNPVQAVRAA